MQQADDFLAESEALHALMAGLSPADFQRRTGFKDWTFDEVIRHLHTWNQGAVLSLTDETGFDDFYSRAGANLSGGLRSFEAGWLDGLAGPTLLATWRSFCIETADRFRTVDPSRRVRWAGPSMSARSSITARMMETWAHGQAVYDELGVVRQNADRIRNVVVLGNNTYGWTFAVRHQRIPEPIPHLLLTAPSGEIWTFNEPSAEERIEGLAEEFCQVVTQVRNVADTRLRITGGNARDWMRNAQCFAGPPENPPAPGVRRTRDLPR